MTNSSLEKPHRARAFARTSGLGKFLGHFNPRHDHFDVRVRHTGRDQNLSHGLRIAITPWHVRLYFQRWISGCRGVNATCRLATRRTGRPKEARKEMVCALASCACTISKLLFAQTAA